MLYSIMNSTTGVMNSKTAIMCMGVALILGMVISGIYMVQGGYSKNFLISLALLPCMVQAMIMLVNGNLGTSVAVMGAFTLVRFRSFPGTSKEIIGIFFTMIVGLATGMGYINYAVMITVILGIMMLLLSKSKFGEVREGIRLLKISIPESLDYSEIFDDIFSEYTKTCILNTVKTTNMGSMFELQYHATLKDSSKEKEMIDALRCRNGNLTISCSRQLSNGAEL